MIRGIGGATPSTYSQTSGKGLELAPRNRELQVGHFCLPTLETAQPEVASSGWKSTARRVVSGAPPAALENLEDRLPPTPGRTHNRIRFGSKGWARGSQPRTRRLSVDGLSCSRGESGSPCAGRGTDWERALRGPFPGRRTVDSELCSECQSEEIRPSAGKRREWINEIPTVPVYYPAKPQPREWAWQNQR
ncbi:Regulator of rDNA transcription protein 15 [Senna tora]|uniref:Regulator of rDNA transcription protein 15 n=1 Tax=Senna tora TaxID=362788 RepID=A0A834W3C0_9FABA|nr:Regulator of rDNA transcription protein 15 [Senna tora]